MIQLDVWTSGSGVHRFQLRGHAGYAEAGSDIVCAAVSVLVYNAINSCERFAGVVLDVSDTPAALTCSVPDRSLSNVQVQLLLQSFVFGVEQVAESYPEFVDVQFHGQ
ncbi:MAG: ribosomal-processing cysteine protease Prp [Alicyclobacillus sp.]|nr:ribosomal-processing cysteine protease Prp [Alicyclobacillus sp.]